MSVDVSIELWRRHRWVTVRHRGQDVVVGTRTALTLTRARTAGVTLGVAYVAAMLGLFAAGATTVGAIMFVPLALAGVGLCAREAVAARAAAAVVGPRRQVRDEPAEPVPPSWGGASRRQPALPRPDRGLPASGRRALS